MQQLRMKAVIGCLLALSCLPEFAYACGQAISLDPKQESIVNWLYFVCALCVPFAVLRLEWPRTTAEFFLKLKQRAVFILAVTGIWVAFTLWVGWESYQSVYIIQFSLVLLLMIVGIAAVTIFQKTKVGNTIGSGKRGFNPGAQSFWNIAVIISLWVFLLFLPGLRSRSLQPDGAADFITAVIWYPSVPLLFIAYFAVLNARASYKDGAKEYNFYRYLGGGLLVTALLFPLILQVFTGHYYLRRGTSSLYTGDRWEVLDDRKLQRLYGNRR